MKGRVEHIFMARAFHLARLAASKGEVPVGAVVVSPEGAILSETHNLRETNNDPTAHAEIIALRKAAEATGSWRLIGCTLYVTLEPCPMCVGAAVNARIGRLVYAYKDPKAGAVDSLYSIANDPRLNHRIEVESGVMEEEAASLLRLFFRNLRKGGTEQVEKTSQACGIETGKLFTMVSNDNHGTRKGMVG